MLPPIGQDIAVPVEKMAEAVTKLQALFDKHHYDEALIFGHAMVGNLHFVFTQAFDTQKEIDRCAALIGPVVMCLRSLAGSNSTPAPIGRYSAFMDDVAQLIAVEYQGSLKGEHGTGRNMAPFVEVQYIWRHDRHRPRQGWRAVGFVPPWYQRAAMAWCMALQQYPLTARMRNTDGVI
jgi:FAD/FMN-containing dehydrogenase